MDQGSVLLQMHSDEHNPDDSGAYAVMRVSDLTEAQVQRWREQGIVFLVGSYVSTLHPTCLPSGVTVCSELYKMLFGNGFPYWLETDFNDIPFEALMQCYPQSGAIKPIISRMCGADTPNPVHEALASSLQRRDIAGIITTNYDLAFEACFKGEHQVVTVFNTQTFKRYCDFKKRGSDAGVYFKIHGTAQPGFDSSIVCNLETEGWLPPWKRKLMQDMVQDRVLLVIGYSGRDFDICPELAETTGQSETVWLQRRTEPPTANSARVLTRRHGIRLEGDLLECLDRILGVKIAIEAPTAKDVWTPAQFFDSLHLDGWRMRILDWIACPSIGMALLPRAETTGLALQRYRASMYAHIGRYRDAITELEAIQTAPDLSDGGRVQTQINVAAERFIYGQHWRAWRHLRRIERTLQSNQPYTKEAEMLIFETKLMMYMRLCQVLKRFSLGAFLKRVQRKAMETYQKALPILERRGEWGRLEALHHNAERIGIAAPNRLPLPTREGYRSLGMVSMHVIAHRDHLRATRGRLTEEDERLASDCLCKAERYGWNHEAWKFSWILFRRGSRNRRQYLTAFWKYFWKTQYPWTSRVLQLLLN